LLIDRVSKDIASFSPTIAGFHEICFVRPLTALEKLFQFKTEITSSKEQPQFKN
jgi:hypothetical protein